MRQDISDVEKKVHLYLRVHRFDVAEKLIKATLANAPQLANMHNLLGVIYHFQSRFLEAIEYFSKALHINPSYIEAGLNLAATLCDVSRYDDASKVFLSIQEQINPHKKQPDLVLGRLANHHAQLGSLYEESRMFAEAIGEYREALSLYDKMPDIKFTLARLYYKNGQIEKARSELEEIIKTHPLTLHAENLLGILYWQQGKGELARGHWLKAQQIEPNDSVSRTYLSITENMKSSA